MSKDTVHFTRRDIRCIADGAFDECYKLKTLAIGGNHTYALSSLTNLETLFITEMPSRIGGYFGGVVPITLKNIVIAEGVKMNSSAFAGISGVTIFVEASKVEAQHWDENYPGWNNGNKVVYGGDWVFADFYGADDTLTNSGIFKTSQVIRVPYIKDYTDGINQYVFKGFDIDGDGVVDSIPATSSVDIEAKAIFSAHCLHSEFTTIVQKKPTCIENGIEADICDHCGDRLAERNVSALGHTKVIDKAVAPTCTETGLTEGKHCSVCNEVLVKQTVVDALGHTEVIDKAVAPTCIETGLTEGKHCSVCNTVLVPQEVVKANGHTEVIDKAVAPTCTETGLTEGKHCSVCNTVLVPQEIVKANGHTEVIDKAVDPTCTETGLTEGKHCDVCKEVLVKQTVVDALGHTEVIDKAVAPTCTTTGLTEGKHCSVCNTVLVSQTIVDALGHNYESAETLDAINYTCTICGDHYTEEIISDVISLKNTMFTTAWGMDFITLIEAKQSIAKGANFRLYYNEEISTLLEAIGSDKIAISISEHGVLKVKVLEDIAPDEMVLTLTFITSEHLQTGSYKLLAVDENSAELCEFTDLVIYQMGDVNLDGKVNSRDATMIKQYVVKMIELTDVQKIYANVYVDTDKNGDPIISSRDATLIQQFVVKMDVTLGDRIEITLDYGQMESDEPSNSESKPFDPIVQNKKVTYSIKKGDISVLIPEAPEGYIWSESEIEFVAPEVLTVTEDKKFYLIKKKESTFV